jgi:uncharacterized protein DUF6578
MPSFALVASARPLLPVLVEPECQNRRMTLCVFVESWQLEENGSILCLGREVEWRLAFRKVGWWSLEPVDHMQHLTALGRPLSGEAMEIDRFPTELSVGEATLYWDAPEQVEGELHLVGSVHRDVGNHTPEDLRSSRGVIRRLRMETRRYQKTGHGWDFLDNTASYEEVQQTYLPHEAFAHVTGRPVWLGVLVELETGAYLS